MFIYVLRRAIYSIPVLLLATFLVFCMVSATFDPTADVAQSREAAAVRAEMREDFGLNRPLVAQYGDWLSGVVRGDLGDSWESRQAVSDDVKPAFWNTMQLITWGIVISTIVVLFVGVYSAVRQYSVSDYVLTGLAFVGIAMPAFWFGLIAYDFSTKLADWFNDGDPIFYGLGLHSAGESGINGDYFFHLVLPVATLTIQIIASWSRYQRASMLDVLSSDYIRTARAKGVPRRRVIFKHGLRNALIPFITVMALDVGALFGGLVVTEQIFSIPGMGRLFVDALVSGDAPVVLAWLLVASVFVILFNLLADLAYSALDPQDPVVVTTPRQDPSIFATVDHLPETPGFSGDEYMPEVELELIPDAEPEARSQWQLFRRRFVRHRMAVVSLIVLVLLIVACFGASWIAPYERNEQDLVNATQSPSLDHLMGTDRLGRDLLTEILYAGQVSLSIGLAVAFFSTIFGALVGAFAAFFGRATDQVLSRITDLFLVVPALLVAATALSYVRRNSQFLWWDVGDEFLGITINIKVAMIVVLAFLSWTYIARIVRGQVLSVKEKEFIEAARVSGGSGLRIIFSHIIPNSIGVITVNATLTIAVAIVTEATLSFLGFGLSPPDFSWGYLIYDARGTVGTDNAFLLYFPGLMLLLTVLCVNFLGDGLRDAFDPHGRQEL